MAGRPKHYEEEELIDRATQVFWKKGYTAASAQDLLKVMGIGQGSFYRSFPGGKRELYQKTLQRFLENSIKKFNHDFEESSCPIKFIKDFFDNIPIRTMQENDQGCYLGNAIVELSNIDNETKDMSVDLLKKLKDGFEKALLKAKEEGKLDPDKCHKSIALYLVNLWNGLNVTQRMYPEKEQIKEVLKLNLQVLD